MCPCTPEVLKLDTLVGVESYWSMRPLLLKDTWAACVLIRKGKQVLGSPGQ